MYQRNRRRKQRTKETRKMKSYTDVNPVCPTLHGANNELVQTSYSYCDLNILRLLILHSLLKSLNLYNMGTQKFSPRRCAQGREN